MTKVLVCGGRDFEGWDMLNCELDSFHDGPHGPITKIIHGGARGADTMAEHWAEVNKIEIEPYKIKKHEWTKFKGGAGPMRNRRMHDTSKPDYVLAFPGGPGTRDMVTYARKQGTPVICIGWDGP